MYTKFFVIFLLSFVLLLCAGENDRFGDMSAQKIDELIKETSTTQQTVTDKMNILSQYFLGTPYALYEPYPLVNFDSTNCMAYCEHVLALSISDSWDNFFNNLQQIRYKDGMIGMRTRNHYTMGDWLPENNWLLDDVSRKVGGSYTKTVSRTISHAKFFQGKVITDLRHVKPDYEMKIDYIPKEAILDVKGNLQNGDIGALIFSNNTDIFSAHMWMLMEVNGQIIIR